MRKKLIALACVLCFSFMLTACGNSENKENTQGTGTPSATVTEQPTNTPTEVPTSTPTETPTPTPTETPTPHEHSYTSTTTKEATCTELGEKTYTCDCGDTYKEDIAKISHTESDWLVVTEVTATTDGLQQKICTVCNEELASEVVSHETFVVASGKLEGANVEWKIVGTTLYVSGVGEIPDFQFCAAQVRKFPELFSWDDLVGWQKYDEVVEKIVVEDGITKIGRSNFESFYNVKEITFADSVVEVGSYACNGLGVETINLNNISKVGTQSFGELKKIKSLVVPGTISTISKYCFTGCANLTEIYVEEGIVNIKEGAFECLGIIDCTIYLPSSLKSMADSSLSTGMTVYVKADSYAEQAANEYKDNSALTIIVE